MTVVANYKLGSTGIGVHFNSNGNLGFFRHKPYQAPIYEYFVSATGHKRCIGIFETDIVLFANNDENDIPRFPMNQLQHVTHYKQLETWLKSFDLNYELL